MKLIVALLIISLSSFAQKSNQQFLLDSLNKSREADRAAFNLYAKKLKVEVIAGGYRNRAIANQGFEPINFTYNFFLPFQFDLNYVHLAAREKIMKINMTLIVHHSKYGNYAMGLGNRLSFLVHKKSYLNYQFGLVWCEPIKKGTNDGINYMGFCLHHQFSFSYTLSKNLELSANVVHLSSGNLFKNVKNNQDVIGIGLAYSF